MLQIPYKNIDEENYLMKILLLKRINDEEVEKGSDPRLQMLNFRPYTLKF